jgi:hypothetical protein
MALHIRVVTDGLMQPDAGVALRRTLIGAASGACLGFGFVPAFFDPEGRAFHDRILGLGAVPLTVLEEQMRAFIRQEAAKPAK